MMTAEAPTDLIGFPVPLLGNRPLRLAILWRSDEENLLVLEKPPGVAVLSDNWYPRLPVLTSALNHQIEQGKGELRRIGLSKPLLAVHTVDPEIAGPVLYAGDGDRLESLRNALGSGFWRFLFRFVAKGGADGEQLQCALPLARHQHEPRVIVSHTTGKSAETFFRRVSALGGSFAEWEAICAYPRLHQVFAHARECGLLICGADLYGGPPVPSLADLKRSYRPSRRFEEAPPLYPGPLLRLAGLRFGDSGETARGVEAPAPRKWDAAVRLLREFA